MCGITRRAVRDASGPARPTAQNHPGRPGTRRTPPRQRRRSRLGPRATIRRRRHDPRREAKLRPAHRIQMSRRSPGLELKRPPRPRKTARPAVQGSRGPARARGPRSARHPRQARKQWAPRNPPARTPIQAPHLRPLRVRAATRPAPASQGHMLTSASPPIPPLAWQRQGRTQRSEKVRPGRIGTGPTMFHVKHPGRRHCDRAFVRRMQRGELLIVDATWGRLCEARRT